MLNNPEALRPHLPLNIQAHLRAEQSSHPEATGALTSILNDLAVVAKLISHLVNTAGLQDMYGVTGATNVQGESVLKLDERANDQFKNILLENPNVAGFASEEEETFVSFSKSDGGRYVVWFDPLDGSSNFDTNVSIGSIFAIYRRVSAENDQVNENDFLQKGSEQVCSGYFLYGASTMFVYTTGHGVYGFTLNPNIGEFMLPDGYSQMRIPESGNIYSVNEGYSHRWSPKIREYIDSLKTRAKNPCSARYIGSLVADLHRTLRKGGAFLYPRDSKHPEGKLRLCCELNPLALLVEQAGGMATDGQTRILEIKPERLHQRSPVVMGSRDEVGQFNRLVSSSV